MKVIITGANGFIGKNLTVKLHEQKIETLAITRDSTANDLSLALQEADFIFHLAGINRPTNVEEFTSGNTDFTRHLCECVATSGRKIPIVFSSSTQAELDNPYGKSKYNTEQVLIEHSKATDSPVYIYRLPNVFGKWCRPNYNSAVATFCHNIVNNLPIKINDPHATVSLVYIDDVVESFLQTLQQSHTQMYCEVTPVYSITVGELAKQIEAFKSSKESLITEKVGEGIIRRLYSTYVSHFLPQQFSYQIPKYGDSRGVFVEMLKTQDSGQFSFFTAPPDVTRGEHYHHTKTEKFLVIKGNARFRFRHIITNEVYEHFTTGDIPEIVETIPGWAHDITNVGDQEMVVMLWANEIFDR